MMGPLNRIAAVALVAMGLAACSSQQNDDISFSKLVIGTVADTVKSRGDGPPQIIVLTPEQLSQINEPVIQINPEQLGGSDFLRRAVSRRDSGLGTVEVWNSSDNAQVFLRNGVVVGTRGVGGDIISADADVTVRALSARSDARGIRSYVISDGDVTTTDYQFQCTVTPVGSEDIIVAHQRISTDRLRETCIGGANGDSVLRNMYWVQRSTGVLRKSRQWIGPRTGYFEIIVLKN